MKNVKRVRVEKACDSCRLRKTKCNGGNPCEKCVLNNSICTYTDRSKQEKKLIQAANNQILDNKVKLLTESLITLTILVKLNKQSLLNDFSNQIPITQLQNKGNNNTLPINEIIKALKNIAINNITDASITTNSYHPELYSDVPIVGNESNTIYQTFLPHSYSSTAIPNSAPASIIHQSSPAVDVNNEYATMQPVYQNLNLNGDNISTGYMLHNNDYHQQQQQQQQYTLQQQQQQHIHEEEEQQQQQQHQFIYEPVSKGWVTNTYISQDFPTEFQQMTTTPTSRMLVMDSNTNYISSQIPETNQVQIQPSNSLPNNGTIIPINGDNGNIHDEYYAPQYF